MRRKHVSEEKNRKENGCPNCEHEQIKEELDVKKRIKEKLERKDEEIESLKKEVDRYKNEYYRAFADTQNLRKNLERDHRDALKYRSEGFLEKLLPVIDSFNIALKTKPEDPVLKNYLKGFEFIYSNILEALQSEGVVEIDPKIGDKLNTNTMHAVDVEEKEGPPDLVTKVYSLGMKLHDKVIRPAMVVVSKPPTIKETNEGNNASEKLDA